MKKTKILVVTLLAGIVLHQTARCQTNATADATPAVAGGDAASVTVSNATAAGAAPTMTEGGAPPAGNETASATNGNAVASASESNAPAASASTNDAAGAGSSLPPTSAATNTAAAELPIQFHDVPITAAIESLARLAGINYLLDPRISYGQLDQNGQPKP